MKLHSLWGLVCSTALLLGGTSAWARPKATTPTDGAAAQESGQDSKDTKDKKEAKSKKKASTTPEAPQETPPPAPPAGGGW